MSRPASRAIASTPYDTAWVAAVPQPHDRRDPRFPTALTWIGAHQHADGSWGSAIPYVHDRIICTLAALIPLARYGRRQTDREQVRRGERYLWQHAHLLNRTPCELVGFELLLPTLIRLATEAGVHVPPQLDTFGAERDHKLALLPRDLIYSPHVSLVHSLEFLGADGNPNRLLATRAANGSIGNSPAATAYLLHYVDDSSAVAYLEQSLAGDAGAAVPVLDPCETYEALWTAYHQWLGGVPASRLLTSDFRMQLQSALQAGGVSLSPSFPAPDADDTAVALVLLAEAEVDADAAALQQFERDDYFVSFPYERHPSCGVNIHVLQALKRYKHYPQRERAVAKILQFLRATRQQERYWLDKWHVSPYYATSRAIIALTDYAVQQPQSCADLVAPALEWLLWTQNEDGSWGFFGMPTAEETAYALLALLTVAHPQPAIGAAIQAGRRYLLGQQASDRPALWIDKCLYYPIRIVEAAIQAALDRSAAFPAIRFASVEE